MLVDVYCRLWFVRGTGDTKALKTTAEIKIHIS